MITHLWEVGFTSSDKNTEVDYRIEMVGVDRDDSFRQSFKGKDVNEVKLRAINFIIDHHKLKSMVWVSSRLPNHSGRYLVKALMDSGEVGKLYAFFENGEWKLGSGHLVIKLILSWLDEKELNIIKL